MNRNAVFTLISIWAFLLSPALLNADGKVIRPRDYHGSLEERAQEAIIVFQPGSDGVSAVEDLILKISVTGNTDHFAWVVPFPAVPETAQESSKIFNELFAYCELRSARPLNLPAAQSPRRPESRRKAGPVLKSQVVGSFQVTPSANKSPARSISGLPRMAINGSTGPKRCSIFIAARITS